MCWDWNPIPFGISAAPFATVFVDERRTGALRVGLPAGLRVGAARRFTVLRAVFLSARAARAGVDFLRAGFGFERAFLRVATGHLRVGSWARIGFGTNAAKMHSFRASRKSVAPEKIGAVANSRRARRRFAACARSANIATHRVCRSTALR